MGRLLEAGVPRVRLVRCRRSLGSRCLVGPAVFGPYRQAVVGAGLRLTRVMSGAEWQQCRARRRSPPVRSNVATPGPGYGGDGLHCSLALSCLLNGGTDFEGIVGRLLGAGLSGGRLLGVVPPWCRLLVLGRLLAAGLQKVALHSGCLWGAAGPMS